MILFALAAAALGPPGILDTSDARTVHTETVGPNERLTPDCRQWTLTRQKSSKRSSSLEAWVEGVFTGYNVYHAASPGDRLDLLENRKLSAAFEAIDQRCSISPAAAVADVTLDLIAEWRKR